MESRKQIKCIAILGTQGMLGYAMNKYYRSQGSRVIAIDRAKFNPVTDDMIKLSKLIDGADVVVNCIGVIKPRITQMTIEEVLIINGTFPKNLAKLTKDINAKCIHITTDCVYSGCIGNYNENDYLDAIDLYGLSKSAGESLECMTLRTSILGEEKKNKYSLLEWAISQKDKPVTGYTNHIWNGVTTLYLAQIIEKIILQTQYREGIHHIHSAIPVTKYELLEIINNTYKLNLKIHKSDSLTPIDRSLSSIYGLSKHLVTKTIKQQVEEMHSFFRMTFNSDTSN